MDISKKLDYYRQAVSTSSTNEAPSGQPAAVPASVKALVEHFNGRILNQAGHVVEIHFQEEREFDQPFVFLHRLSKGQIKQAIPLDQCLFFDLETTGLSGGTGTYPFLFGFGYFTESSFKVVQYFLPDFGRDYFVFKEIQPLLESKSILISFNGKSYDFPLLKSRAILNRFQFDFEKLEHIDLLHLVRRVWRDSQQSCDLASIEREQLQLQRQHDIPGAFIPSAYLRFVQSGVIHEMIATIHHNLMDIVSLKKILLRLHHINQNPQSLQDIKALIRLAKLALELNDRSYFALIEKQLQKLSAEQTKEFQVIKSLFLKKQKEWRQACVLWENLINHGEYTFWALEELAKTHEHVFKNHVKALEYTQRALKIYQILEQLNPYGVQESWKRSFLHRMKRLKGKIS